MASLTPNVHNIKDGVWEEEKTLTVEEANARALFLLSHTYQILPMVFVCFSPLLGSDGTLLDLHFHFLLVPIHADSTLTSIDWEEYFLYLLFIHKFPRTT